MPQSSFVALAARLQAGRMLTATPDNGKLVAKHRGVAAQVRAALQKVLPALVNTSQVLIRHDSGPASGLEEMQQFGIMELVDVMQVLPGVMDASQVIASDSATQQEIVDAATDLARLGRELQRELEQNLPFLLNGTEEYLNLDQAPQVPANVTSLVAGLASEASFLPPFYRKHLSCVADIEAVLLNLVRTAEEISYVPVDCEGAGAFQLACAGDMVAAVSKLAKASEQVASTAFDCGRIHEGCVQLLASGMSWLASGTASSLAAVSDCVWPTQVPATSLACTVDALDSVNAVAQAANSFNWMLLTCDPTVPAGLAADLKEVIATLEAEIATQLPGFSSSESEDEDQGSDNGSSQPDVQRTSASGQMPSRGEEAAASAAEELQPSETETEEGTPPRRLAYGTSSGGRCAGINQYCWINQQCCSARCSRVHRCRPIR